MPAVRERPPFAMCAPKHVASIHAQQRKPGKRGGARLSEWGSTGRTESACWADLPDGNINPKSSGTFRCVKTGPPAVHRWWDDPRMKTEHACNALPLGGPGLCPSPLDKDGEPWEIAYWKRFSSVHAVPVQCGRPSAILVRSSHCAGIGSRAANLPSAGRSESGGPRGNVASCQRHGDRYSGRHAGDAAAACLRCG